MQNNNMEKLEILIAGEIALSKDPGSTMKKWREIFGINQTELAEALKVSSSTISDYEGGRRKSPGIGVVSRLVDKLLELDLKKGSKIRKQLEKDFKPKENIFDVHEFKKPINGKDFAKKIEAEIVACPQKLKEKAIYGFTVIDSLKVILDVPVHEYMQMYGKTPERALFFDQVETGRSPLIAVKIARFSIDMKPAIVVLHGLKKVDPVAIKIAEAEKIPLLVINKSIKETIQALEEFE
jgi:putative transcriptional regulator